MPGIIILVIIMGLVIGTCEFILYHKKRNGVDQDVIPSLSLADHMNIITQVNHRNRVIRRYLNRAHKYDVYRVAKAARDEGKIFHREFKHN